MQLQYLEPYSRTKAIAERYILESDGKALQEVDSNRSEHDVLRTCALRLAGVYGPGEQRHVPRTKVSKYDRERTIFQNNCAYYALYLLDHGPLLIIVLSHPDHGPVPS